MDTTDRILSCLSSALSPEGNNAQVAATLAGELDDARSTAAAIDAVRNPSLTTGQTLDHVARLVNVTRTSGESDDSLRTQIITQIRRYYSCGTLADIRDVVEYFTGLSGDQIRILEPPEAHDGWGYGEGRYGALPWGTPHAMFRIEFLGEHTPVSLPGIMTAIDLVRSAGVYVPDLIIRSTPQEVLISAEGSTIWDVPAPLRTGFGAEGYGTGGYGYCQYAVQATAEGAVDLQVTGEGAVMAGIRHGLEPGRSPYGWEGYGGRVDAATIEYVVQADAAVEASAETEPVLLVETLLGYGAGRLGTEPYGTRAGSVDARAESAINLVIEPTAAVTAQAASYLGYGGWQYGRYEYGF